MPTTSFEDVDYGSLLDDVAAELESGSTEDDKDKTETFTWAATRDSFVTTRDADDDGLEGSEESDENDAVSAVHVNLINIAGDTVFDKVIDNVNWRHEFYEAIRDAPLLLHVPIPFLKIASDANLERGWNIYS